MRAPDELDVFECPLAGIRLIEASAGTGKTWNLCGLYLRLLLERDLTVQGLLVVTFTNAATAELRERIRARIAETIAHLGGRPAGGDPFVARLVGGLRARGLEPRWMRERLELALQTFDEAAIFTIHGFCQRALADAPFAAQLPLQQEAIADDAELLAEAANDFWRRHVAGAALSAPLAAALLQQRDSPAGFARLLRRRLARPLARLVWPADIERPPRADGAALEAAYAAARDDWRGRRAAIVAALLAARPGLNGNVYSEAAIDDGADAWDACFRSGDAWAPLDLKRKGAKLTLYRGGTLEARCKKGATPPRDAFFALAEDFLAAREALDADGRLERLRLLRALLAEGAAALRAAKRERRVVAFDDMLGQLHERLAGAGGAALAASLKARFPAALIDEFQDTDPLQFAIFDAVYGTGDAPLFLVGDPKQAIYSFRNADLHTYLRARRRAAAQYSLAHNQRSSPALIAALNALFGANARAFMLDGLDYRAVTPGERPRPAFDDRSAPRAPLQLWRLPADADGAPLPRAEAKARVVAATAAEIARLLGAAAEGLASLDGRALAAGDIAVLVRSHGQGSEMRRALAALGVASVEIAQASVYRSSDAEELERVLAAVLEPARERLLRAALATELLGLDAAGVAALDADEAALGAWVARFAEYRELWLRRGIGLMLRRWLTAEGVAARLLARADGERRLTNLLHLAECLQQAAAEHASPQALLRWLQAQRRSESGDEAAQLRLESDRNLVQIVTIHKSKGLEYPIVFCPFLWDGWPAPVERGDGVVWHDAADEVLLDFRAEGDAGHDAEAVERQRKLERSAEDLRLAYVALTRAVHRCYLVAGCYAVQKGSTAQSERSLLNWLAAGDGTAPGDWLTAKRTPGVTTIEAAWDALARDCEAIGLAPLPAGEGVALAPARVEAQALAALPPPRHIPAGWRIGSYSALSHGATHEGAAVDRDARATPAEAAGEASTAEALPPDDMRRFPRGPAAGDCVHALLERVDFGERAGWPAAIAQALRAHPQPGAGEAAPAAMLARLLDELTRTELVDGLRLEDVPPGRRLAELEFDVPARGLAPAALNEALAALGYAGPRLAFATLSGYLKGYIDLVLEHGGRWYVVDWKSNHLGADAVDYGPAGIARAMAAQGYHLQQLLYALAVDRWLRQRLAGYDYERDFGGVLYLFVRGVRPHWRNDDGTPRGVHFHRPAAAALRRLGALLDGEGA